MGRAPCCDKANVKKGAWSPDEDSQLKAYIEQHGTGGNWTALPQKIGLKRCGKSCRLRWLNYLKPNIKLGGFSEEEDSIIYSLYLSIGSRWSTIAAHLPGRTDNAIKNYWHTKLKKKLVGTRKNQPDIRLAEAKQTEGKDIKGNLPSEVDTSANIWRIQAAAAGTDHLINMNMNGGIDHLMNMNMNGGIDHLMNMNMNGPYPNFATPTLPPILDQITGTEGSIIADTELATYLFSIQQEFGQEMFAPDHNSSLETVSSSFIRDSTSLFTGIWNMEHGWKMM